MRVNSTSGPARRSSPSWQRRAACAAPGVDPEWFFPEPGQRATKARRICAHCPVKAACLAEANATHEEHGIRGGLTPLERTRLRHSADKAVA